MKSNNLLNLYAPTKLIFGPNSVHHIGEITKYYGSKVFVVTMKNLVHLGLLDDAIKSFDKIGIKYTIYSDTNPEPTCDDINQLSKIVKNGKFDVIVGFGGGSCMDLAKGLAILANHPKTIWSYVDLSNKPPEKINIDKVLPVVTVPTASGTGSEVTPYAVFKNTKTIQKGTIKDLAIFPKVAIIDPYLTFSVPKELTASIGVDALSHMLENYFNIVRRNPYSDALVEKSLGIIAKYLPLAYRNGKNLQARSNVALASALAGIANANAGTTVVHALSHPAGARLNIPHGISVSMFSVSVMKETIYLENDRLKKICQIFGVYNKKLKRKEMADKVINFINELLHSINMTPKLSDYTREKIFIETIVDDALSYMSRPIGQHVKVYTKNELLKIVKESF